MNSIMLDNIERPNILPLQTSEIHIVPVWVTSWDVQRGNTTCLAKPVLGSVCIERVFCEVVFAIQRHEIRRVHNEANKAYHL